MDSSNAKQTINHVKCAWNSQYDSENKKQTVVLFLVILWASACDFNCKSLLTLPATCLNQYKALNWLGTQESVLTFLWIFLNWLWLFLQLSHVCMIRVCLCIYRGMELGQNLAQKSIGMMIEYLIGNHIFLNLHDWKKLPNLEILHLWLGARNFQPF